jgi:NhaP-type Na+/H+ or K+/H+ antiporter
MADCLAAGRRAVVARQIKVPYPTFLAIGGMLLAFVPSGPSWTLEPDLALALFVAPVLLDAAFDTSLRDLRDNWLPVSTLVFIAVGVTAATVAVLAHWLLPDMPWAAAIALGAIVAPPDAAAATAILRRVKLPYRILKILEGESLLNDASALLIYRVAVGAAAVEHFKWSGFAPSIVLALAGSLAAGYLFATISMVLTRRITDAQSSIIVQFAGTFTVWIVAEHIGLSGILTIVAYAITMARTVPTRTPARLRVPSYAVWETAVFVLNVLAFMLIGLQLRPIWERLDDPVRLKYCQIAAAVLGAVILTRIAWVMTYGTTLRFLIARGIFRPRSAMAVPTVQGGIVVAWCGMRGIVTLAAAFALPESFPYHDLMLLTAFAVVLGTLVIQGLTLRPTDLGAAAEGRQSRGIRSGARPRDRVPRGAGGNRRRPVRRSRNPQTRISRAAAARRATPMAASPPANSWPIRCRGAPSARRDGLFSSCANPKISVTTRSIGSRKNLTGRN